MEESKKNIDSIGKVDNSDKPDVNVIRFIPNYEVLVPHRYVGKRHCPSNS